MNKKIIVGIDASRNKSGGAIAHMIGIISSSNPLNFGVSEVHIWSHQSLLNEIPSFPWLIKHIPSSSKKSILHQMWWQYYHLPIQLKKKCCDVLLATDAGSVCNFSPSIVMSRDMLSFEPQEMSRFAWTTSWLRLFVLRYVQINSLKKSTGAIFLTKYASTTIQGYTGELNNFRVIPHGVSEQFRHTVRSNFPSLKSKTINCIYVSNSDYYKHQWSVIEAISILRKKGLMVNLLLLGAGSGRAKAIVKTKKAITQFDPKGSFVSIRGFVPNNEIPNYLLKADLFVFASSCENMPNTLIEAMASGLPIACSNFGPMPEVLLNGAEYFNPEIPDTIVSAVETLINSDSIRNESSKISKNLSDSYSWTRCGNETWSYLRDISVTFNKIDK